MKKPFIWLDGSLVPWDQATVHVGTHTLHYGSGAFEGIRSYKTGQGNCIFRLEDHCKRLLHSFSAFNAHCPWSQKEIEDAIKTTVKANQLGDSYIRPMLFFGSESLMIDPRTLSVHYTVIEFPLNLSKEKKSLSVGTSKIKRLHPESAPLECKVNGFYVNSIFSIHDVQNRGYDEALLLDHQGLIAEGSVANIFFVIDDVLVTPPTGSILPGITRATVITLAKELNITFDERFLKREDIEKATEAFFTGTLREITPIKTIDDILFSSDPGFVTKKLMNAFDDLIAGKNKNHKKWLTYID